MVRNSQRKLMINALNAAVDRDIVSQVVNMVLKDDDLDSSSDEQSNDELDEEELALTEIEDKVRAILAIQLRRYLGPRARIEKAPPISEFLLHRLEDKRFKQEFRMTREMFLKLCGLVSVNPVFQNNSHNSQRPVEEQMMITLKRLGCFGNGSSVGLLGTFFRVGEGTIELYTDRCLMAILGLKDQLLTWPNTEARQEIQEEFNNVGFNGCVGVIDGTLIVLQDKPEKDGPDYYNRKGSYGVTTLLICDKNKKINYVYTRWPGCSHDQRLTSNCSLTKSPLDFFSRGQYLLADSAFSATINIVPAFKRTANKALTEEQHKFNRHLSGIRVVIENSIGLLKNRFQSLKGLRLRLANDKDLIRINTWIQACTILHNFVLQGPDWEIDDDVEPHSSEHRDDSGHDSEAVPVGTTAGKRHREEVMHRAQEFRQNNE